MTAMTIERDPPIKPMDGSNVWIDSPPAAISKDIDASVLAIRLGMSMNALIGERRRAEHLAALQEPGAAKMRDMILSFVNSASITKEAVNILTGTGEAPGQFATVVEWGKEGKASDSLIERVGQICGGSHPVSPILVRLRNQLGFHWDPAVIRESLLEFQTNESVVWAEGVDERIGSIVHRLASDVLANALAPPSPEEKAIHSAEERAEADRKRVARAMRFVVGAMEALVELFHSALVGFLNRVDAEVHRRKSSTRGQSRDAGLERSLEVHHKIENLYPRVEQHAALFRGLARVDSRLPHPPGITPGARLDPIVCALAIKAATTKRAILTLCECGDGDNALALARVMLENACLLEWLIRGEGRQRLETYVMFLNVVHERIVETISRHRKRFISSGTDSEVSSDPYSLAIWRHTFLDPKGTPTKSSRPTWTFDLTSGKGEPVSVKKLFGEIAGGTESFEYDVLYGAIGSDIVHSGPFSLAEVLRELETGGRSWLRPVPSRRLSTIALASSNTAMFLVLDSLTQYLGLDLSAELAPMKAQAAADPYAPNDQSANAQP